MHYDKWTRLYADRKHLEKLLKTWKQKNTGGGGGGVGNKEEKKSCWVVGQWGNLRSVCTNRPSRLCNVETAACGGGRYLKTRTEVC